MDNLLLIFICLSGGALLRNLRILPDNTYVGLNAYVINIALPSLSIYFISNLNFDISLLFPASVAWILVFISWIFFALVGKIFNWPDKLIGCLILTTGFANTSFLGFPIIEAFYGEEGLEKALIVDQVGSFMALSTLGLFIAQKYSHSTKSKTNIFKRLITFPPFIAFCIAILINFSGFSLHWTIAEAFHKIGITLVPVALVSVGIQWRINRQSVYIPFLIIGSIAKLIVFPIIIFIAYYFLGAYGITAKVSIMEAAMPSMITASILAINHNLKKDLANLMVGVGLVLSSIILPLWYYFLEWIF
ncbi:AEC family transporter [Marinigracilibium pacificum]|uniref:AEC family transporter n=1 Tax=Marinigracilibium pacificum TaxID=2729599 RepID=A0A848J5M7_9BACT|nr:AEC family transporter [Marinigracilibium pacificum]NMM48432.1 AEC family transporter [Marinigracilibium pacificum]